MSEDKENSNKSAQPEKEPLLLTEEVTQKSTKTQGAKLSGSDTKTNSPVVAQSSAKGFWFASVLAFLAIGLAFASAYRMEMQSAGYESDLLQKQQFISSQSTQIESLTNQLNELNAALSAEHQSASGLTTQLDSLGQLVSANQQRLDSLAGTERSDWQLAEVEYLLRLANQRLMMSGEVRGSKALLESADEVLLELDDIYFLPVREAIANDIAALNRADRFDLEGLYLRIASLAENLDFMELRADKRWQAEHVAESEDSLEENFWQAVLNKALATLSELVVIRSSDKRILPQMNDVELMQLQQGMHFLLEQAKYAVIAGKQNLYDSALASLQRWLTSYYDVEKPVTAATLREIESLQGLEVSQQWPDISASLDKLKMLMKARLGLPQKQRTSREPVAKTFVDPASKTAKAVTAQGEQQ